MFVYVVFEYAKSLAADQNTKWSHFIKTETASSAIVLTDAKNNPI